MTDMPFKPGDAEELTLLRRVLEASPSFLHVLQGPDFVFEYANKAENRGEFLGSGMDMLAKPFTFDALAHKVQTMLNEPAFDGSVSSTGDASAFGELT